MKNFEGLKKGDKFWSWWLSRNLYFRKMFEDRTTGAMIYVFDDIADMRFNLTEDQFNQLERRG